MEMKRMVFFDIVDQEGPALTGITGWHMHGNYPQIWLSRDSIV
jgi:hypothetical protein